MDGWIQTWIRPSPTEENVSVEVQESNREVSTHDGSKTTTTKQNKIVTKERKKLKHPGLDALKM